MIRLKRFTVLVLITLYIFSSSSTSCSSSAEIQEILKKYELTPERAYELSEGMKKAQKQKEEQENRELVTKILVGIVIFGVILAVVFKVKNSNRYQFFKDYAYMLKLSEIAKEQNTTESSIAVLCRKEKQFQIVNEIFAFCVARENLNQIIIKHNATLKDFEEVFRDLNLYCCLEVGDKFLPVSTFFSLGL